jgi:tetratricopeptide (TPR) repeat protein
LNQNQNHLLPLDDTQCLENIAFDSTSNQCTPNIGEFLQGDAKGEGRGFSAKMPEECTPKTEIEDEDLNELIQDAMEYLKKGDYVNAVEYSEKAITINSRIALAYNTKGQALLKLKNIMML